VPAQNDNPVYVDNSPIAWELFLRAQDQTAENAAEAVRLFQELLDEYAMKLAPVISAPEHLTSVRHRVLAQLRADPDLLERYRIIESAAAQRMLEAGDLRTLAMTRSLTTAGLEAMLRLGQQAIEEARFETSRRWLDEAAEHPDLDAHRAAHCWFMIGLAGHYLGDGESFARARAQLGLLGADGAELGDRLDALHRSGEWPSITVGISAMGRTSTDDLSDLVAEEIWSVPLNDSLLSRRFSGLDRQQPTRDQHRRAGDLMTAAATVAANTVYVNQGHAILALDRFTGRERWTYLDRHRLAATSPDTDQALDMNFVTVHGDFLVTLTGHASADERSADGKVLCLRAADGTLRWSRSLDRIGNDDDHEGLFPHGEPVITEGTVYVLARKVTKQYLTNCYVVALDVLTGDLRWVQHVASSGGLRRSARALSTLCADRGDLYVATAVGAVARLDAETGEIRWLQRYNVPISPRYHDESRRPWELPAPVVVGDTVVAIQPGHRRIVVLDRATGHEQASYAADTREWNSPRYLLASEHSVYAIGREIRAFRIDGLAHPVWRLPRLTQSTEDGQQAPELRLEIRGRVQLADGALIVPTLDGVMLIDDETGRLVHLLPVQSVGTPVATDAQLLLAGSDSLDSFMSFRRAERMLRQRIAAGPTDPEPSLSLLRLGARARRLDLALEAARLAMDAIGPGTSPNARQELFNLLLEMDGSGVAETLDEGRSLHAMIGMVAVEPDQRVEHLLSSGRWLADHDLGEAIERYQEILSSEQLSALRRAEEGLVHPAGYWAARRLGSLISEHGPNVYAPQADFAQMRLDQVRRRAPGDTDQLQSLAREFPFADTAPDAALAAASALTARGDHRAAIAALLEPYRLAPEAPGAARLLVAAALVYESRRWDAAAADLLRHLERNGGPRVVRTPDGEREVRTWLAALDPASGGRTGPRVGQQEEGHGLGARLLPVEQTSKVARPTDAALLLDGQTLVLAAGPGLAPRWRRQIDDPAPQLLHRAAGQMILWLETDPDDPRALMLDEATGEPVWSTPPLSRHLGDPIAGLNQQRGVREQMPSGAPFDPTEALPLVRNDRLVIVQRSGGSIAFDLADGSEPIWAAPNPLEEVHLAALHELGLVLVGRQRQLDAPTGGMTTPRLVVADPATGDVRFQVRPLGGSGIRWMCLGPLGALVYATAEGLEAVDLASGSKLWTNLAYPAGDTQHGWLVEDRVVIEDNEGRLRAVRLADGVVSEPFELPPHGEWDPLELQDVHFVDGLVYGRYRERVICFDDRGTVLGADVVTDARDYRWILPVADGLLLVSRHQTEHARVGNGGARQTQHTYLIYHLSRNCKVQRQLELAPVTAPFADAAVIDGALLLSTQTEAVVIPMPID
jgi:outer membrane protein assembly factor BamB